MLPHRFTPAHASEEPYLNRIRCCGRRNYSE